MNCCKKLVYLYFTVGVRYTIYNVPKYGIEERKLNILYSLFEFGFVCIDTEGKSDDTNQI